MKQKVVTFGELMLRLTPSGNKRLRQADQLDICFGGSEANVAAALAGWDVPCEFVTALPANDIGLSALRALRASGTGTGHILLSGHRMGLYFVEPGSSVRAGNVIYDRAGSAFASMGPGDIDWEQIFGDASWFHWSGITPAVSPAAAEACRMAIRTARDKGLTISADFNYRSKLWNYGKRPDEVIPPLLEECDVLLGDIDTAFTYLGIRPEEGLDPLASTAAQLMERLPRLKTLAMTFREIRSADHNTYHGVLFSGTEMFRSEVHDISSITDRVGTGDAFMAGLIYGLASGRNGRDTIELAAAAGALKHTVEGDVLVATIAEVEKLALEGFSGKINR